MNRFMLMQHTKNNYRVTVWSDGGLRVETMYKRRVNIAHVLTVETFAIEEAIETLPRYAWAMVVGVSNDYYDWKSACADVEEGVM